MVDEAESVNELIALDAQRMLASTRLPAGFEDAILRRTVYGEVLHYAGRRWTSWLGWVAAAACMTLAASIWIVDRHVSPAQVSRADRSADNSTIIGSGFTTPGRSWTTETPQPAEAFMARNVTGRASSVFAVDHHEQSPVDADDSQTLYAASTALEMLTQADLDSFADADRIRRIAEYDGLLDRLAETRTRLSPADRPPVLAAESVLVRIVNGPLDLNDLRVLHETVDRLDLTTRVQAISERSLAGSSL